MSELKTRKNGILADATIWGGEVMSR